MGSLYKTKGATKPKNLPYAATTRFYIHTKHHEIPLHSYGEMSSKPFDICTHVFVTTFTIHRQFTSVDYL